MSQSETAVCGWRYDTGLLILRLGIGISMMLHGWPKLMGGAELWGHLGQAMGNLGITFLPVYWGFAAACAEFFGGLFLALGLAFRIAAAVLVFQMIVASTFHLAGGDGFQVASHAIELLVVFFSLIFIGPGRCSLDGFFCRRRRSGASTGEPPAAQ
ncbi:DoxX family protein [bacterium]|nr:DoxX family protein [bacterium]